MQVAKSAGNLSSIESCTGLGEATFLLQMVEELSRSLVSIIHLKDLAYLSTIQEVQHEVELVFGLEAVVERDQERMVNVRLEDVPLCHHVLHLVSLLDVLLPEHLHSIDLSISSVSHLRRVPLHLR